MDVHSHAVCAHSFLSYCIKGSLSGTVATCPETTQGPKELTSLTKVATVSNELKIKYSLGDCLAFDCWCSS